MHKNGEIRYGYLRMMNRYVVVRADNSQHADDDDAVCYSKPCELRVCFRSERLRTRMGRHNMELNRYVVVRADDSMHVDDAVCYSELCELSVFSFRDDA